MGSLTDGEPIGPRTRVRRAAMLLLLESAESTFSCLPAARAGEAETGIHDMRVAAKRLRERMVLFQPVYKRRDYHGALDPIDALNDVLGVVRDSDVLTDHLGQLAGGEVAEFLVSALPC